MTVQSSYKHPVNFNSQKHKTWNENSQFEIQEGTLTAKKHPASDAKMAASTTPEYLWYPAVPMPINPSIVDSVRDLAGYFGIRC